MRCLAAAAATALFVTPATADSRIAGGFMMGRPIAGLSGGADHALVLRGEHGLRDGLDLGLALHLGYAAGNSDESLMRFAVLPTLGLSRTVGDMRLRADLGLGWMVADGTTNLAGIPVTGTEARGLRAELGISLDAPLSARAALRGRAGLALSGLYPDAVDPGTRSGPLVEVALVFGL
jgi:hypothetical protein